jgi:hypothetical protein
MDATSKRRQLVEGVQAAVLEPAVKAALLLLLGEPDAADAEAARLPAPPAV